MARMRFSTLALFTLFQVFFTRRLSTVPPVVLCALTLGRHVVPAAWVAASTAPHAHVPDQVDDYGYFFWLKSFSSASNLSYPAFYMSGNGGSKIVVLPSLHASVVITSTNYNTHGMHQQTEKLLTEYILPMLQGLQ